MPTLDRWRAPVETTFAGFGIRMRSSPAFVSMRRRSVGRYSVCSGSPGLRVRAATSTRFCALRTPGSRGRASTTSRDGCAVARCTTPSASRKRPNACVRRRSWRSANCVRRRRRSPASATCSARWCGPRTGSTHRRSARPSRLDLRCFAAVLKLLTELEDWQALGESLGVDDVIAALERSEVSVASANDIGRVAVVDVLRARTRRYDSVFVLGLEEGSFPRRGRPSPFLDDEERRRLGRRLELPDQVSRDRYLFYTACTRAVRRLHLVREAATDEGAPREPSPFCTSGSRLCARGRRACDAATRTLGAVVGRSIPHPPTASGFGRSHGFRSTSTPSSLRPRARRRERLVAAAAARPPCLRARDSFAQPDRAAQFGARSVFGATELERFVDCSSAWLFERVVDPKTIDAEVDPMPARQGRSPGRSTRSIRSCRRSSPPTG